jgi:hypothetical protein
MADGRESYQTGATQSSNAQLIKNYFAEDTEGRLEIGFDRTGTRRIITVAGQDGAAYQRFLYVTPDGKNFAIADYNQIVRNVKKDAGGNIEQLRSSLYAKGYLTEKEYSRKSDIGLSDAILDAANDQSREIVETLLFNPNASGNLVNFNNWLNSKTNYASEGPRDRAQQITKLDANQMIDAFTIDMLGREATPAEKKSFFDTVSLEMKKAVVKQKTVGSKLVESGSLLNEEDYSRILAETIKPAVRGTPLEAIASGTGAIAQSISSLKSYAANYGIKLSTQEALDDVLGGLKPGGTLSTGKLDQQQQKIRNMAKSFYTNLGDSIDNGVSIKNLSSQFANLKSQVLEVPSESLDAFDKDIQMALRNNGKPGVMSTTEFEVLLRNKPEWGKTKNAREEAAGYANDILKMFGLVG